MSVRCLRTDYDIAAVYSYQTEITRPLIDLNSLDLPKILHIRNFWLRHLLNADEATFYTSYAKLPASQRPQLRASINENVELNTSWLGYWSKTSREACIHPYPETFIQLENRQTCADLNSHWIQEDTDPLLLQIKPDPDILNWPPEFDKIIPMIGPETQRLYFRGLQRFADDVYPVRGFTEPIRAPQGGFPGWQRICFAIYAADRERLPLLLETGKSGRYNDEDGCLLNELWPPVELETDFLWCQGYEGVIFPGGKIMVGQWVDMINTTESGPFIFWDFR
ncbi:hypothetical protein BDV28DRAFT_152269 [Aspergillus coremiiformis]|uniref:Uncharacterized protein n=1 Tax=Aspergillus coremiiformis TaxID=138285 RepID=A0A5N6YV97_9EURO|nr:hypothetical protein BDV28DRAFT_152269 [Aspergillus coremiiformis]